MSQFVFRARALRAYIICACVLRACVGLRVCFLRASSACVRFLCLRSPCAHSPCVCTPVRSPCVRLPYARSPCMRVGVWVDRRVRVWNNTRRRWNSAVLAHAWHNCGRVRLLRLVCSEVLGQCGVGGFLAPPPGALVGVGTMQFGDFLVPPPERCWNSAVWADSWLHRLLRLDVLEKCNLGRFMAPPPGAHGGVGTMQFVGTCLAPPPGTLGGVGAVQFWKMSGSSTWCDRRCWESEVFDRWLLHLVRSEVFE